MDLIQPWFDAARSVLPVGTPVWDAHTHTGWNDPDGVRGTADRLIEKLDAANQAGAVVTTSMDPSGYPANNDRVLGEAEASNGRLIPFLRIDPHTGAEAPKELNRSLDLGHRGVKLHPRGEAFSLADPLVDPILQVAAERGVPVLVHAGRGIPTLGSDAIDRCESVPGLNLILAHAGISDLSWMGPVAGEVPGLHFDTAWWDITDLLSLFAWVPPERILYASDTPYGHPMLGFILAMRAAAASGYRGSRLADLFGGTLQRLLTGVASEPVTAPPGGRFQIDHGLLRLHANLQAAVVRAFARVDVSEPFSLARLACVVPENDPHYSVYKAIGETLAHIDPKATRGIVRPLIALTAAALTPEVAVPASNREWLVDTGG